MLYKNQRPFVYRGVCDLACPATKAEHYNNKLLPQSSPVVQAAELFPTSVHLRLKYAESGGLVSHQSASNVAGITILASPLTVHHTSLATSHATHNMFIAEQMARPSLVASELQRRAEQVLERTETGRAWLVNSSVTWILCTICFLTIRSNTRTSGAGSLLTTETGSSSVPMRVNGSPFRRPRLLRWSPSPLQARFICNLSTNRNADSAKYTVE